MKRLLLFILLVGPIVVFAQTSTVKLTDLAVPSSPAFIITDVTPNLVQNPSTPKSFVLGVAQSFGSGNGFPNNYSAEFVPYWWAQPKGRSIYQLLGLKFIPTNKNDTVFMQQPTAGLKFTSISVAFVDKDLIPDTIKSNQKIFSIGARTTLIKIHSKRHIDTLGKYLNTWAAAAQDELQQNQALVQAQLARLDPSAPDYKAKRLEILKKYKEIGTPTVFKEINDLVNEKPIFSWDIAAAYALYGINDQDFRTGRTGVWTTLSSYIPFQNKVSNHSYFSINASVRYLSDSYQKDDKGVIGRGNNLDIGGKLGLDFKQVSIGVESLYRYAKGIANTQNRTVGIISFRLMENLYINGTLGKDFAGPNKLISAFGINWGFGKEQVSLP